LAENLDDDPLKCLEIFWKNKGLIILIIIQYLVILELFALIGAQNQTIILAKLQWKEIDGQRKAFKFTPQSIFRGHQRSVECLAANKEGLINDEDLIKNTQSFFLIRIVIVSSFFHASLILTVIDM